MTINVLSHLKLWSAMCGKIKIQCTRSAVFAALLLTAFSAGVSAQIVTYTNATTGALNSTAANATATALTRVNGVVLPGTVCSTGFSSSNFSGATTYANTLSAVEVDATPNTGYMLNVTGFNADFRRSATGPASLRFAYSIDGGTTWTDQGSDQANPSVACSAGSTLSWNVSFTVSAPAGLKFRIYGFNATSTAGTEQILNLNINGTVTASSACTPPVLSATAANVWCFGSSTGSVTLTTTGGTTPFTYLWSNGATTQSISGLNPNTYSVTVTASGGCTATAGATVNTPAQVTANITGVTNTACGTDSGSLTVSASGGTGPLAYTWNTTPTQNTATASALAAGNYSVTVIDGHSCTASAGGTITIQSPTGLSATGISNTGATLNWGAVSGAVSYNIQYRKVGTSTWSITTSASTSVAVSGLTLGTAYEFEVQAVCSSGSSSYSASTTFATTGGSSCVVPTVLSASNITTTTAKLNWAIALGGISYNVQYRKVGATTWTSANTAVNSLAISGLANSTTYEFQVQTVCSGGVSSFSASATFTTGAGCGTPTTLAVSNITNTTATFTWAAVSGATGYNIRYRKVGTTTWTTATSNTNSLAVTGLTAAVNYAFQVQAICPGGTGNFSTSGTFTTTSGSITCAVPTGLSVTNIATTSALVTWGAVAGVIRYNVEYRATGSSTWITDTAGANTYDISGLAPSTPYQFQVQSVCASGNSVFSTTATFTTLGPCGSAPSGFSVSNITTTLATINWSAVTGAVSYKIQYRIVGTTSWTTGTTATNSIGLTGLNPGTTYEFQVQIVCSGGTTSAFSTSSTFATSALLPRPDHIVVLIEENHSYADIIGSSLAPHWNALLSDTDCAWFNHSYGVQHPSQPNYLDLFSGSDQGVGDDNVPATFPFTSRNLGRELRDSNLTFITYSEDLPSVGYNGATSGNYARKHNPGANWMGTGTNQIPTTTNQPFTAFPTSTNYASLPTVSYVVPNLNDDMHNGTITTADTWYYTNIYPYFQWAKTHNSLLIIQWDEDDLSAQNQIPTIFAGPMVKAGLDTMHINHYNLLRTIEDMYKLPHCDSDALVPPITNCWKQVAPSSNLVCDWSLWSHVYHSYRLIIHDTCTYVTGTVDHLIYEADGDIHIRLHLDTIWTPMLNSVNISGQYGDFVLEPICATTVTQADAVASCQGFVNTVYIPNVGEHVKVTGSYVTDNDHGWNEIHPVTSIVISTQTQHPVMGVTAGVNDEIDDDYIALSVFPNPSSDEVHFKLSQRPLSVVKIEIMDVLGRSAGQYQMLETTDLQVTTSYLPTGTYFYNVIQGNRVMNSGKFIVAH